MKCIRMAKMDTMPSGEMSKLIHNVIHQGILNTTTSNGSVPKLKEEFALPHFIEGVVETKRSNCETTRQMV